MKELSFAMPLCIIELHCGTKFLAIEHGDNYFCIQRQTHYTRGLDFDDIRHVEFLGNELKIDWSKIDMEYDPAIAFEIDCYRTLNKHLIK